MPDIFVPLDTNSVTDYYKTLARSGYFNSFALTYVEKNRDKLNETYPTFEKYKSDFKVDKKLMDEFLLSEHTKIQWNYRLPKGNT